jgi:tRNA threonylcarbamoyladenosine biosynthesis protein TsaB
MNLLALETSTDAGSIALWRDGELTVGLCPPGVPHSETLLPLIRLTMAEAGLDFTDLHGIAFGAGPGSFTGLRVACGVAQGLAFAQDLPLFPVGTLEAMALASGGERVIVALDARMGEVYFGYFEAGVPLAPVGVYPPDAVPLPDTGAWLACGNGLAAYPALQVRLAPFVSAWLPQLMPGADAIARIAAPRLVRGEGIDPADAMPIYVRDKVARTVAERLSTGGKA